MGIIGKSFAIVMFPLSILIVLETAGIFSITLPFDKIIIGAILMIALQLLTLIFMKLHHSNPSLMNYVTAGVFMAVAVITLAADFLSLSFQASMPIILGVMMFVEALYALH